MDTPVDILTIDSVEEYYKLAHSSGYRESYFKPNPVGYYYKNSAIPVLFLDIQRKYYTQRDYHLLRNPLVSLDGISNEDIVDENGVVVLSSFVVNNAERLLSKTTDYSYYAVSFIYEYIRYSIDSICPYLNKPTDSKLVECLSPEGEAAFYSEVFRPDAIFKSLSEQIDIFIGNDIWFIYETSLRSRSIIIEKVIDYRILDWERMKEEESAREETEKERRRNVY